MPGYNLLKFLSFFATETQDFHYTKYPGKGEEIM